MAFNQDKYKQIFEQRFGKGSYNKGLSKASEIGKAKASVTIEKEKFKLRKEAYEDHLKEIEKARKEEEKRAKEATKTKAVKEKQKQVQKAHEQGRGGFAPSREQQMKEREIQNEYKTKGQFPSKIQKQLDAMPVTEYNKQQAKKKEEKSGLAGFMKKAKKEAGKFKDNIWKDTDGDGKKIDDLFGNTKDRAKRTVSKAVNSASFDVLDNIAEKVPEPVRKFGVHTPIGKISLDDIAKNEKKKSDNAIDKTLDVIGKGTGYLVPGTGSYKAAQGIGKLAKATKAGEKLSKAPKLAKEAMKGATAGGIFGTAQAGMTETFDPDKYTAKEHLRNIGLETAFGAVADPAIYGIGKGLGKTISALRKDAPLNANKKQMDEFVQEVNDQPRDFVKGTYEGQSIVNNPSKTMKLNAPKSPGLHLLDGPNNNPNQLGQSPLSLNEPLTVKRPAEPLGKEVNIQGTPRLNPPVGQNPLPSFIGGGRPESYWQQRLEDFTTHVNTTYDTNRMTQEALEDIWTQFARPDEDVTLQELIDLGTPTARQVEAYKQPEGEPLQFSKQMPLKDEYVSYTGRMNPEDMVTQRVEGSYTTRPSNDGIKMDVNHPVPEEPLQFKKQVDPLQFKQTVEREVPRRDIAEATFEEWGNPAQAQEEEQEFLRLFLQHFSSPTMDTPYSQTALDTEDGMLNLGTVFEGLANKAKKRNAAVKGKGGGKKKAPARDLSSLIENSDEWKDKGNFFLKRETMDRNFEDIMGPDAEKMKKTFLEPVKKAETERIKFLNEQRQKVKDLKIKPKSNDDRLVQKYGEKVISLDELKQQTPNWEKVKDAADMYRKTYDDLLDMVNKVLIDNDFDPIPKRKDYFPHFEEIDGLLHQFGFDLTDNTLPTAISGLTPQFKPNKSFFANALRRRGEETSYGATEGFDRYIEGISNVIYHTPNIKRLRNLEKSIREKHGDTPDHHLTNFVKELMDYTNQLAGKKSLTDRSFEDTWGRGVYNAVDTIRRRVGANMIGANLASATTSYIPLTQAAAVTEKGSFMRGMTEAIANVFKNDGFTEKSGFLTRRVGSDPLVRTLWDKTVDKSMWFMKSMDMFTAQTIVRGKYYEGLKKGLPEEEAMRQADDWAARIMAERSKGSTPTFFNSKAYGILSQFQLEVNNQLSFLAKDLPKNLDKGALASAVGQLVLYSYLFNNAYEWAFGRRPAIDPIGLAIEAYEDFNNDSLSTGKAVWNTTENVANTLPFASAITGGRVPIAAAIPDVKGALQGETTWGKESLKPLTYLLSPTAGGQVKKTAEGIMSMSHDVPGVYSKNKEGEETLKYPVEDSITNNLRAIISGKNAFPETREYYDNSRRPLSSGQTEKITGSQNPTDAYNELMNQRRIDTLLDKMDDIRKDSKLSDSQRENKLQKLLEQLRQYQ